MDADEKESCKEMGGEASAAMALYAGKGMGANVAAWIQAAAAERAAALRPAVDYAQALLDLVKAFDRVPLWLLLQEATALGYPLRVLRLSIATYLLERVIRIGRVVSKSGRNQGDHDRVRICDNGDADHHDSDRR